MMKSFCAGLLMLAAIQSPLVAQDLLPTQLKSPQVQSLDSLPANPLATSNIDVAVGNRWMLICCGLPGDEVHREKLTLSVERILSAAKPVFDIDPTRLRVLVGDEVMADVLKSSDGLESIKTEVCTAEAIAGGLQSLASEIETNDSLWVIFLGHASLYSGRSTFNVKGKDFDAAEFSKWLEPIRCRERVLMLTMPVSGFWIKPLRGPKTVVISATDADYEFTGTEMPYALASVVSGNSEQALEDIDQDGNLSLLDLYLATNLEVHSTFKSLQRLQTEHAQLEDNGDGVGRELQEPYLPVATTEGDAPAKPTAIRKIPTANSDGDLARNIKINRPIVIPKNANGE